MLLVVMLLLRVFILVMLLFIIPHMLTQNNDDDVNLINKNPLALVYTDCILDHMLVMMIIIV